MQKFFGVGLASLFAGALVWVLTSGGVSPDDTTLDRTGTVELERPPSKLLDEDEGYLALLAPHAQQPLERSAALPYPVPKAGQLHAMAYQYDSPIFSQPDRRAPTIGIVRRGAQLLVGQPVAGSGCNRGEWYKVIGDQGFVCSSNGFSVTEEPQDFYIRQVEPNRNGPMPFRYSKVTDRNALRFYELPSAAEYQASREAIRGPSGYPKVVERRLNGDYLIALDRREGEQREFWRTIRGRYIAAQYIEPKPMPQMVGERLSADIQLPLAFVYGRETVPLLAYKNGRLREIGVAEKHARFEVKEEAEWAGVPVVVSKRGFAVPRARVRVVSQIAPPADLPKGERFLHVNLDEQALVAYEGSKPVYATLVSSGKEGYDTPTGLHRVYEKHLSTTMRGNDPKEGIYEVEEVPWTMFYFQSYAVHGAYWHNDFGQVRSHGCTNLAPADARFVYNWIAPEVPKRWNGLREIQNGTYVYLTRDSAH